jgi:hypothetical protein
MSDRETFQLSAAESEYFSNLISHDEPFAALLRSHPEICVVGRPVVLDRADAEMLREYFTERLATIGFDADYEPNKEGLMLERLIDAFFRP